MILSTAIVADRLHEGMPFTDHAGLAAYDNGSAQLVLDLINSDKTFSYKSDHTSQKSFTKSDGEGGSITTIGTGMGKDKLSIETNVTHETMHGAQFLHGQGGNTVPNEVEAYTFEYTVAMNRSKGVQGSGGLFGFAQDNLSRYGYFSPLFTIGVGSFHSSSYNALGLYNNYKIEYPRNWIPLLKLYKIKELYTD